MRKIRSLACIAAGVGTFALAAAPAFADGISIHHLPDSSTLEASVNVRDQDSYCDSTLEYCGWFGEASEYPVSVSDAETGGNCPNVFDAARGIWVGRVIDDPSSSDSETFTFTPDTTRGPIEICLYTTDQAEGDQLDTTSFFAVTKARARVSLFLDSVRGCHANVSVYVNGGNVIGGDVRWRWEQPRVRTGFQKWPISQDNGGGPDWWADLYNGKFTISVKYLGDTVVNPSGWVSVSGRVRHRGCGTPGAADLRVVTQLTP